MNWQRNIVLICSLFLVLSSFSLFGQSVLNEKWNPSASDTSYAQIIKHLEKDFNLTFVYSSNILDQSLYFKTRSAQSNVDLFDQIFTKQNIEYEFNDEQDRVLLFRNKVNKIQISGVIRDKESKESIPGATIYIRETGDFIFGTDDGYFYAQVEGFDSLNLIFNSLTYENINLVMNESKSKMVVELKADQLSPTIIIRPVTDSVEVSGNEREAFINENMRSFSPLGQDEEIEKIKNQITVQNGSEAQTGFVVKGGSPDQNLILVDGMPVYEVSHVGGLSSIFISSAIKDVQFFSGAIPSQYSGRLSSVMDVKINEGNTDKFIGKASLSLTGLEVHTEGPLKKERTAFSISGKFSWLGLLAKPFLTEVFDYKDSRLSYYDVYAKFHHKFNPANRLSITYYKGNDQIGFLSTNPTDFNENIFEEADNELSWGNELLSVQWNRTLLDNVFLNTTVGASRYQFEGLGAYSQYETSAIDTLKKEINVRSRSEIENIIASINFQVYNTPIGNIKFGAGAINHFFKPDLTETILIDGQSQEPEPAPNSRIQSFEYNFYFEDLIKIAPKLYATLGFNWSKFIINQDSDGIVEPRIKLNYSFNKTSIEASTTFSHQYVHLLVNPGPGLPSDLWIPSRDSIPPSRSRDLTINLQQKINENLSFKVTAYYRTLFNIKEYIGISDVYFAFLNNEFDLVNTISRSSNWEDRVNEGEGFSYGVGGSGLFQTSHFNFLASYLFSQTVHSFEDIQETPFRARYDRPHNLTLQTTVRLTEGWSLAAKFKYGTGLRYTLPIIIYEGPTPKLSTEFRNNATFRSFHHLDLSLQYQKETPAYLLDFRLGVYNVYNRKNVFYSYLTSSNDPTRPFKNNELSLLPILPNLVFSISY